MKKINIVFFCIIILSNSCVYEDENDVVKKVVNSSSQKITAKGYRFGELRLDKSFGSGEIVLEEKQASKGSNTKGYLPNFQYDSLTIETENKIIKYL